MQAKVIVTDYRPAVVINCPQGGATTFRYVRSQIFRLNILSSCKEEDIYFSYAGELIGKAGGRSIDSTLDELYYYPEDVIRVCIVARAGY